MITVQAYKEFAGTCRLWRAQLVQLCTN